jgi:transposase
MLSVVWNPHGFHAIKVLPRECKWASQDSIDSILPEFWAVHIARDRRKLVIHVDNPRSHVSTRVKQFMEEHGLRTAPHPPYSPDRAPSDFFLFEYVKRALQRSEFQTLEELLTALVGILNPIPTETLISAFHEWIRRLQTCIDIDGEYVESGLCESNKLRPRFTRYRDAKGKLYALDDAMTFVVRHHHHWSFFLDPVPGDPFHWLRNDLTKAFINLLLQLFQCLEFFACEFRLQIIESKKSRTD